VSRASKARKIATAAAVGGGGLGAVGALGGAAFYGLIVGESKLARRRIPKAVEQAPALNGTTWAAEGVSNTRPPIQLAVLGDSTAAGYGVHRERDTPGARLAISISTIARRPVRVTSVAVVGSESAGLAAQVALLGRTPDIAVIMIGANDVTHRIKAADSVRALSDAVASLRAHDVAVVVGTCPDLGTIRPIAQPLRYVARRLSRQLAAAQTVAVVEHGGVTVSLGDLLGPLFAKRRDMFSEDRFHPSATGYAAAADAMLPSCLELLGLRTKSRSASAFTTRRARPVAKVAAQAAAHPGTEVSGAEIHGSPIGRRGQWARLRRRRPQQPITTAPEQARPVAVSSNPASNDSASNTEQNV
jgi:lysophospholipase L1-like esterase